MAPDETLRQPVTQPTISRSKQVDVLTQQSYFFVQLPIHGLFGCLVGVDAALRKLPSILPDPPTPKEAVLLIAKDDSHVGPKTVVINHNWNQV